ncbi:hypothetical protein [Flagellimonas sp.]|uniref:hypothetical protein n=1 Tax=Flagellimonas sp. TaxID=2058762 RepID=UPI003B526444
MGWFQSIFKSETQDWFFSKIPFKQTPGDIKYSKVDAESRYIEIFLKSMRIVNLRKGFSKFYPTVHSHIEIAHKTGKSASFNVVTTSSNLELLDSKNIDRVINFNRRLLGPIPYRGSDVKIEAGLFAVKEDNLAKQFIALLDDISSLGGVSFISAALPYVQPLEHGIELLTGSKENVTLEIGLNVELNKLETGYYAIIRVDKGQINVKDLLIDKKDFRLTDKKGNPFKDYPYMVLEISARKKRDDWYSIPEISKSYNNLKQEVLKRDYVNASDALKAFKYEILTCPDLLYKDAKSIYQIVEGEINEVLSTTETSGTDNVELKELRDYQI